MTTTPSTAKDLPSWNLTPRQFCDVEMILNGAFAPLQGFLSQADYTEVVENMRLSSGELWPIPITLDVSADFAQDLAIGQQVTLRNAEFVAIATLTIESIWQADKTYEAQQVYGTTDSKHTGVDYLLHRSGSYYLGGKLTTTELPEHYDYRQLRHTPAALKAHIQQQGWERVLGYHSHNPMHRQQQAQTADVAQSLDAQLLIHASVGENLNASYVDHFTRVRCYEHVLKQYPADTASLSLFNLAMRMAGPREALWHALIRKNYGCTHFLVERQHASPNGDFYSSEAAYVLVREFAEEIGIEAIDGRALSYVAERDSFVPASEVAAHETSQQFSDAELLSSLDDDTEVPAWYSFPEVMAEIHTTHPPRHQQGFTVFFTGLSGSGKSTVANALRIKLLEIGGRPVTLLDGDVVRTNLSSELSFSKEHRDLNIRRIGFVASEITKNGGIAICAPIAPYTSIRREVRDMIEAVGGFIEVHVSTPIEECERRDRKGLYAKARAGLIKQFTGIDDPYEVPEKPEWRMDTTAISPDECAQQLLAYLTEQGFIKG